MYTDPFIVHDDRPDHRSHITFYTQNKRYRCYNGRMIGLHCYPNKTNNPTEKLRLLKTLHYEIKKKLENGWRPGNETVVNPYAGITLSESIQTVLRSIRQEEISDRYKADLRRVSAELVQYLRVEKLTKISARSVDHTLMERFLESYKTSSAYYMIKRSSLAGVFTRLVRCGILETNPVWKTTRKKVNAVLNRAFSREEVKKLLGSLKEAHPNLHLCGMLMYGCFLRPHREIRALRGRNLSDDSSTLILGGNENKGKQIRIIRVPSYLQELLHGRRTQLYNPNCYIITGKAEPFNPDYFKTAWGRIKAEMFERGLVQQDQTLYSFRHAGAIELYQKTKRSIQSATSHGTHLSHSNLNISTKFGCCDNGCRRFT